MVIAHGCTQYHAVFLVAAMNVVQTKPGCSALVLAGMLTIHCRGVSTLGRNGGGETLAENQRYLFHSTRVKEVLV